MRSLLEAGMALLVLLCAGVAQAEPCTVEGKTADCVPYTSGPWEYWSFVTDQFSGF